MPGIWLLPTRQRVERVQKLLNRMVETGAVAPGLILVQKEELAETVDQYDALELPEGWDIVGLDGEGYAAKIQEAYEQGLCRNADWIGVLADDLWPETQGWEAIMVAHVTGWNLVAADDLWQAPRRASGALIWSRDLIDTVGYLAPRGLRHLFIDDVWERLGERTGCLTFAMNAKVRHNNAALTGNRDGTVRKITSFWEGDNAAYRAWVQYEMQTAENAILGLMKTCGVAVERPNLEGVSIYLCTPAGDGTYHREYVRALEATKELVRAAGGKLEWGELPYCSDLPAARARLLGAFMRSASTHMLMIDADMGWDATDVLRLVGSGLDVVGGAGPRKEYPLRFCVDATEDDGTPTAEEYDAGTGALTVSGIGTGFLMVTRSAVKRLIAAHPELAFDPGQGQTEYALFDPLISNRRRKADDFAFCHRWRAIGGKVYCLPSIKLKHVGAHTFYGSLFDAMVTMAQRSPEIM